MPQNKLFVTGDVHGEIDIGRLDTSCFHAARKLTKNDYVIVAGDFGLPWSGSIKDLKWLKWLDKKSFTKLFVDGNHENFNFKARLASGLHCNPFRPSGLVEKLSYLHKGRIKADSITDYLESLYHRVQFKHWYFGQYHLDYLDENTTVLYYGIVKI